MDPTLSALPRLAVQTGQDSKPSPLEEEVVNLFDQFRDRLIRYALSFGLSIQDSEEIVQDVFLALFQHLQRGKSRQNLRGWVFRVTHNLALKQRERSRRNPQIAMGPQAANMPVDPAPSHEEELAGRQREQRLQAVLRALPEQDQRCLYLRAEGLRYREIAEALGVSLGSVSMSMARSLARLSRSDRYSSLGLGPSPANRQVASQRSQAMGPRYSDSDDRSAPPRLSSASSKHS